MSDSKPASGDPFAREQTQQDGYYESLLEMEKNDPDQYSKLSPAIKMGIGYYVERKERAQQSQGETK